MTESALVPLRTIIFIVKFAANFRTRFGLDDLSFDGMGEHTVEAILAVAHIKVNAGIETSINVDFAALGVELIGLTSAFINCEILVGTQVLDRVQFLFQPLILQELLVVHLLNNQYITSQKPTTYNWRLVIFSDLHPRLPFLTIKYNQYHHFMNLHPEEPFINSEFHSHSGVSSNHHFPSPFILEKIKGLNSSNYRHACGWTADQKIRYLIFVFLASEYMQEGTSKQLWTLYGVMATFLKTKNKNQCRIYHKHVMREHYSIDELICKVIVKVPNFKQIAYSYQKQLIEVVEPNQKSEISPNLVNVVKQEISQDRFRGQYLDEVKINQGINPELIIKQQNCDNGIENDKKEIIKTDTTVKEDQHEMLLQNKRKRQSIQAFNFNYQEQNDEFGMSDALFNLNQMNNSLSFINPMWSEHPPMNSMLHKSNLQQWKQCHQLYLSWIQKLRQLLQKEKKLKQQVF